MRHDAKFLIALIVFGRFVSFSLRRRSPRRPMRTLPPLVLSAALILGAACSRPAEPAGTHSPPSEPSARPAASADNRPATSATVPHATASAAASAGDLVWTEPAGWQRVASESRMRKATYKVPAAPKDTDEG